MKQFFRTIILSLSLFVSMACYAQESRPVVTFETTEGKIVVELYNETPLHRDNFLRQVKAKLYDGVLFHRVINNFMIQSGDPLSKKAKKGETLGNGTDKPADWIPAEIRLPQFFHHRGALAAAREGDEVNPEKKSSNQQFYIVTGRVCNDAMLEKYQEIITEWTAGSVVLTDEMKEAYRTVGGAPHLDGSYTVFGQVLEGMEIVDRIQQVETDENNRPLEDIRIITATITSK